MTGEDTDRANVDAIVADNPALGPQRDLLTAPESAMKLIALASDPKGCICSAISVMTFPLNDVWKENFADEGFLDGVQKLALPGTRPTSQPVKTPTAEGVRITMRTTAPGSGIEVIMTQYYLRTSTSVFLVSYTVSPDSADLRPSLRSLGAVSPPGLTVRSSRILAGVSQTIECVTADGSGARRTNHRTTPSHRSIRSGDTPEL